MNHNPKTLLMTKQVCEDMQKKASEWERTLERPDLLVMLNSQMRAAAVIFSIALCDTQGREEINDLVEGAVSGVSDILRMSLEKEGN